MSFFIPTIPPPQKTMKHLNSPLLLLHLLLLHLFFIFISQIPVSSSTPTPTPKSLQLLSLLSLKTSLKDPLSSLSDWNATSISLLTNSSNPFWCSWSGIECDTKTHDIISLDLSHRNLSGSIPPQIKFLTELNYFNLSGNSFDGLLSTSIFELYQLQSLDISHNNFSGNFPLGISKFKSLLVFDAYSNSFTGSLPLEFTRLRVLEQLNLGGSYFDGGIPASYGRIPTLKYLHLAGNSLTGEIPPELGFLNQLEHLEIGYNYFNGGIPVEISLLPNLKYLDISSANLSGQLASELGNLTALESLFLFKNQFIGEIPVSFSKLVALKALDLSDNQLTGQIPEEFSSLKELTLLSLLSNNLTGKIPDFIGELPNLETLLLWNNSFTGYIPRNLGLNSKLQKLDLSSNSLSGPIPPTLCYGNKLVRLILFSNKFESQLPNSLSKCSSLWRFRIENNKLNGSIPIGFGSLPNLTYMDLSMNEFSGKIPSDLGNSVRLEYLNISKNRFEPELPENIWKASNLQIFSASFSNLNGRIPDFIGCKSLYKLELEGNDFNGSIPWDIGNCEKLLCLNLRNNSLSGIIPWELSTLPSITDIDLSHNLLSGSIPSNFDTCKTLESFNVSFNILTGSIPSSGTIFPNLHPSSFSGNKDLCGEILKKPCFTGKFDSSDNKEDENVRFRHEQKKITGAIVWIMAVAFGIGIFILIAGSKCFQASYSRRLKSEEEDKNKSGPWKLTAFQRLNYTVDDVLECLSTSDKIIGMGSTGTVYKAEMPNGEIIAVKKLWVGSKRKETARMITMMKKGGGVKGVLAEVEVLGNVRHRNIVRLLGCIRNRESTLLLYEYMPGGSLDELLHGKSKGENNDWVIRYKIALGVAQGICYLHHDCDPVIVHRDVKPCNILLDGEMEARVADFGVAKLIQTNESMSVIAGSCGYIAPEYAYTLQVDEKSDIYSFGVVLMEILSGKKSVEAEFGEGNSIVDWVKSKIKTKDGITDILDKNAGASCTSVREEMMLVLRVALLCTSRNPADRPSMRDVVSMLHEAKPHRKTPGSLSNVNSVVVGVGDGNGGGGDTVVACLKSNNV